MIFIGDLISKYLYSKFLFLYRSNRVLIYCKGIFITTHRNIRNLLFHDRITFGNSWKDVYRSSY